MPHKQYLSVRCDLSIHKGIHSRISRPHGCFMAMGLACACVDGAASAGTPVSGSRGRARARARQKTCSREEKAEEGEGEEQEEEDKEERNQIAKHDGYRQHDDNNGRIIIICFWENEC